MARWEPARADVIAEYAREVLEVHPRGRLLVGLDGIEFPGESSEPSAQEAFARDLATAFRAADVPSEPVRMADYVRSETAATDPERFYDLDRFRAELLAPYRAGSLALSESTADGWRIDLEQPLDRSVLVVFGPFLHMGDLAGIWHTSAWLQLGRAAARNRDAARLGVQEDAAELDRWYAAIDLGFRRLDARKLANATFDLTDPAHPRRRFEDAC